MLINILNICPKFLKIKSVSHCIPHTAGWGQQGDRPSTLASTSERKNENKNLSKFYFLEWGSNSQPVAYT